LQCIPPKLIMPQSGGGGGSCSGEGELVQQAQPIVVPYPGSDMRADEVLVLAETYYKSAERLLDNIKQKSSPPYRLLIIHAIELYLNAYLLACGTPATAIRGMQHDLAKRQVLAEQAGLQLRKKTALHLHSLSGQREYLVSRYGSPAVNGLSQLTRLRATVEQVRTCATVHPKI
jgi:hypothetical protein